MPHDDIVLSTRLKQHPDVNDESSLDDVSWLSLDKIRLPVRSYRWAQGLTECIATPGKCRNNMAQGRVIGPINLVLDLQ
jgi:hypothetical protein